MPENLEVLEMPHPWALDIPIDEVDPETIYALLTDQLLTNLTLMCLRYLNYDPQTKITMEQLALHKMQDLLPNLKAVRFSFHSVVPSSYVVAILTIASPTGGIAANIMWDTLPKVKSHVYEELGELYKKAAIVMMVEQTKA